MTPDQIATLFTRSDGSFLCARWGRPVAPVVFGLADDSLNVFSSAIRAVFTDAGHPLAETDPDMGANLILFFVADWAELGRVPDLDRLTGVEDLPARLSQQGADQYRIFRFDPDGSIRACLCFTRITGTLAQVHPAALAESLAVRATLTFARDATPSPDLARLIRAAYTPVLPSAATDNSHALRLAARMDQPNSRHTPQDTGP